LEAPYQGPYRIIKLGTKTATIQTHSGEQCVSIERLKPANVPTDNITNAPSSHTDDDDTDLPYCICRQPFNRPMIGCDGPSCDIEWYHLDCIGLSEPPEGDWLCDQCIREIPQRYPKQKKNVTFSDDYEYY
jgi:hypothetical protein